MITMIVVSYLNKCPLAPLPLSNPFLISETAIIII